MPAIRDKTFAYEAVTTDGGLTIPMCGYEAGDLLLVFLVGDTGTPTVGVTGSPATWNQLFQRINTCSLTVLWRYATASEPDVVLTASAVETYSGCMVAVRDVYQGYTAGSPPVFSQTTSTGTKIALPTITTSAPDSLVLAAISRSGTSSISFVEAALQDLVKVDGTAEGLALGWFFKQAAGLTTAYNAAAMASAAGGKAVIECRAPAGGADVVPTYPVSDDSILLTPSPGVAYDSNTVIAATADTNFGTSIAGKTCNDATVVAAVTDIGIDRDAFMSFAGLTNVASATAISGAEAVVAAARYNVGDRNILAHFRHAAPSSNQRLSPIGSGRGVWLGMRSGASAGTNWKVWQVHGADAPMPPGAVRPIIVNAANADTIAAAGTLSNADVRAYGFWVSGLGALTNQAAFGPMWAMDTTVLAGGNAAEPMEIPAIVQAAALNKVRYSSQLQGANQMFCLQAIQFGDGGTSPIYLKVNGGAVEFPGRKNTAKKTVNYNGLDNSIGWTFNPGAGDTIDLAGTAFSSANEYHWRVHASASASAVYNFTGVALIGAGDVVLRDVVAFSGMSFTDCGLITQNGAAIDGCKFTMSPLMCDDPAAVSNCSFTAGLFGYAIEITTPGTYTFNANAFAGYGADGTTDAAIYNNSGGAVTLNITGGGDTPTVRNGAGATTTINNSVTLTLSGLQTGSDIVILDAGTSTIREQVDANAGTSYPYSFSTGGAVDIGVLKAGYVPLYVRNFTLPATDASLPISQTADRNYL